MATSSIKKPSGIEIQTMTFAETTSSNGNIILTDLPTGAIIVDAYVGNDRYWQLGNNSTGVKGIKVIGSNGTKVASTSITGYVKYFIPQG